MIVLTDEQRTLAHMLDEGQGDILGALTDSCFASATETPLQRMLDELLAWSEDAGQLIPPSLLESFRAAINVEAETRARFDKQLAVLVDKMMDTKRQAYWAEQSRNHALESERQARTQLDNISEARRHASNSASTLEGQLEHEKNARLNAEAKVLALQELFDRRETKTSVQAAGEPENPAGLFFPYSTKELEAMRAASLKYWANYTPDKRQPTQKAVGFELCELLGLPLQSTGEPARKAMILATAIRPDTLPGV